MNAGPNKDAALKQALENARSDGFPRYVHRYGGTYWIDKGPCRGHQQYGSDYMIVHAIGTVTSYNPADFAREAG